MSNGHFNGQTRAPLKGGNGADPAPLKGGMSAPFREKPGFSANNNNDTEMLPGKAQKGDRSGGVKRIRAYPDSEGL